jgi:protein translocase SecG subunit
LFKYIAMLKFIWLIINTFVLILILIKTPTNGGLENFSIKSNLFGSTPSVEKFLNNLTWFFILSYFILAIKLNF